MKKNSILVKCDDNLESTEWVVISPQGQLLEKHEHKTLADFATHLEYKESEIHFYVASPEITIRNLTVPPNLSKKHLEKVIPHLLEEDLISNIDALHFSYGKTVDGKISVAIINQEKIKQWKDKLSANAIHPKGIHPLCLALQHQQKAWSIWFDKDMASVQLSPEMGFTLEKQLLPTALACFYQKTAEKPTKIISNVEKKSLNGEYLEVFPEISELIHYDSNSIWGAINKNFRKFNLISTEDKESDKRYSFILWHSIIFVALITTIYITTKTFNIVKLNKTNEELTQKITILYKQIFPQSKTVTSPKQRIEQELKLISHGQTSSFYELLYSFGQSLSTKPTVILKNVSYKGQLLTVTLEATDYKEIEELISQLKNNQLNIKQNKTQQQKEKISVILAISRTT